MESNFKLMASMIIAVFSLSSFLPHNQPESSRMLPDKLRGIELGIEGSHFPNPTYAVFENGMYIWKHDTSLKSSSQDLQIVEYGSYIYTDKGWLLRVTFTPEDFAKNYRCKNAILKKGKKYTDPASWRRSEKLIAGDALWYYLAKDKNGKMFKGTALVETEAKMANKTKNLTIDVQNSKLNWTGYAEVGNYSLSGTVNLKSGSLVEAGGKITSGKIVVDLTSIDHADAHLKEHLKSADFFETAKYPEAVLVITDSKKVANNVLEVSGTLKIKTTTKPITFRMKSTTDGYSGKIKIDRTDFGVQYGSKNFFDNLGDRAIRNDFDLEFSLKRQ